MEDATWEQRLQALTHILTSPTTSPNLHSQFFISSQIPCYLNWDYPPFLCTRSPSLLTKWTFSLFLKRVFRLGPPRASWRSKCPFQQPPPLVLAKGLKEAEWGQQQRRAYARERFSRKPLLRHIILDGFQHEQPDYWLNFGNPREIEWIHVTYEAKFYGTIEDVDMNERGT